MKKSLRQQLIKARKEIFSKEREKKNKEILKKLISLNLFKKAHKLLIYISLPDEVDTHELINEFQAVKTFAAPRVDTSENLSLYQLTQIDHTEKNKYGILEPFEINKKFKPSEIDLAIIPGVGFDLKGNRLGFGKGYYDKLLKQLKCPTIGLAYDCQILDKLPLDEDDEPMDMIITEKRII